MAVFIQCVLDILVVIGCDDVCKVVRKVCEILGSG